MPVTAQHSLVLATSGDVTGRRRRVQRQLDLPPEFLARFEVYESLGRGGMGEVFRARWLEKQLEVAIKFCVGATSPEDQSRLEQEAALTARIRHPCVVTVHEVGSVAGTPFLVMERVEGTSLRSVLEDRGRLPVVEVVMLMEQVLDGLDAAHNQGVVHRDLKPDNLLITTDGKVKILDLGVARSWADGSAGNTTAHITGTPAYMSPEQCKGQTTGLQTDLYAAGVMIFELISGQHPFTGEGPMAILKAHIEEKIPRISEYAEGMDRAFDHLLARALAKSPTDRFADAAQFKLALQRAAAGTYSASHAGAIANLETRSMAAMVEGPLAMVFGAAVLSGFLALSAWALVHLNFALGFAAILPPMALFYLEEPGRFAQLAARGIARATVYMASCAVLAVMIHLVRTDEVDLFLFSILTTWLLAVMHLATFGGYHAQDAKAPGNWRGWCLSLPLMAVTAFLLGVLSGPGHWATRLGILATGIAGLGALRPAAKTRHMSIGQATTTLLLGGLGRADAAATERHAARPSPRPGKPEGVPTQARKKL